MVHSSFSCDVVLEPKEMLYLEIVKLGDCFLYEQKPIFLC